MDTESIKLRLQKAFEDASIEVFDLTGGSDHFEVNLASSKFVGMSRIQQHQAVMSVFPDELASGELHAFSIKTQVKENSQ